ncbi:MAG: 23S rRNA (guanosine(2251)-2'-O)-methyltransferase RlmB [Marinilabiliales bacterium]|nr:MAG: 23S rRNA (guanosine(2251)-2'-O)-methyltransferase RlmB [Marinilabiliales bacterium]
MRKDIIYGIRPVMEAVEAGSEIDRVFLRNGLRGPLAQSLLNLLRHREVPFQFVPVEKLNRISRINHQGVIAMTSAITWHDPAQIIPAVYENGETPFILVLDGITDVRNFGAVARTALCAGVHAIVVPVKGSAMTGPDAIKTSAGALHTIPVCRTQNLTETVNYLKESGLKIVAATEKAEKLYHEADLRGPAALVMGSEEKGISPDVIEQADIKVKIPVSGPIGSLNVSAAASVLVYEMVRQRSLQG